VKYAIVTFGCRVNQADSRGLEEELRATGGHRVPPDRADVVVVNTCSVTASADQGARQAIRRVARTNPGARIMVTGCYATRRPDEVGALQNVEQVVSNDDKPFLVSLLPSSTSCQSSEDLAPADCSGAEQTTAERFGGGDGACGAPIAPGMAGRTVFTLRVQTGCSEPCAYCIIPATRGRPSSLRLVEVLREVDRARSAGFKEIVLTGVHLGSYGRDLTPPSSLTGLLRALAARQDPGVRFRMSSLEPMDCSRGIVDIIGENACFAPHFHLPLQHASEGVLKAMRRPYTLRRYGFLVDRIRAQIPSASIGADVIVGFPGETDEDFECLASYLRQSPITHLHVFPYSDRPGTEASERPGKVAGPAVRSRAKAVRSISGTLASRFRRSQIGTVHRALTLDDGSVAVTGNYLRIGLSAGRGRNEWIRLRITSEHGGELLRG